MKVHELLNQVKNNESQLASRVVDFFNNEQYEGVYKKVDRILSDVSIDLSDIKPSDYGVIMKLESLFNSI